MVSWSFILRYFANLNIPPRNRTTWSCIECDLPRLRAASWTAYRCWNLIFGIWVALIVSIWKRQWKWQWNAAKRLDDFISVFELLQSSFLASACHAFWYRPTTHVNEIVPHKSGALKAADPSLQTWGTWRSFKIDRCGCMLWSETAICFAGKRTVYLRS